MRKVIQIILAVVIVALVYVMYDQIMSPLQFQKEQAVRESAVIERIKDIRTAERAYKQAKQGYTADFDSLVNFILNDSLVVTRSIGSADDSVAVAKGLVKTETYKVAVIDTVFSPRKLTPDAVKQFSLIPHGNGAKFILDAGVFTTESKVVVPVFECKAPYKIFLEGLDEQEIVNLIDSRKVLDKYPGIKVGAMDQATNDVGNWE